ncbi:MAG: phage integrase N-terminal SAM-like domain-containing protein [Desulfobacteraceae bacterium]|jgi:hypothetical protein|nr:phage integrase N-terminal SAM-like domain-containing protein [Desulfobacteraceae bacterium]
MMDKTLFFCLTIFNIHGKSKTPAIQTGSELEADGSGSSGAALPSLRQRTEQTYCNWIVRFIRFHGAKIHPAEMGKVHIEGFLSHLATRGEVSAATQRQALNAIVFLYRHVLGQEIEEQLESARAKRHARPPTVMTQAEVGRVMAGLAGTHLLMVNIL